MHQAPVPDIAALREIVHSGKLARDRRAWYAWSRALSIHLTWLLLHLPVTADQVTIASVMLAAIGVCLVAAAQPWIAVAGAAALFGHHFLDKVDGDIARYRGTFSLRGVYLDDVGHAIAGGGLFLGLGIHLSAGGERLPLIAGALGALAMVIGTQSKNAGFLLFSRAVLAQPELMPKPRAAGALAALSRQSTHHDRGGDAAPAAGRGALARLRDAVLVLSDYTLLLPLATAALLVEALTRSRAFLTVLLLAAAALQLAVLAALIVINYAVNVENECRRLDAVVRKRSDEPKS